MTEATPKTRSRKRPRFAVVRNDCERSSKNILLKGDTTIIGRVEGVGGATETRCLLRVPGRSRVLHCHVQGRPLARRLGRHLYENIVATGTAIWVRRAWKVRRFTIKDFTQPALSDPAEAIDRLRAAGLSAWDDIEDPEAYLAELKS